MFQLRQYKALKELAQMQGAVLCQQADKMHWEVRADSEKVLFDQRRKKEIEVRFIFPRRKSSMML